MTFSNIYKHYYLTNHFLRGNLNLQEHKQTF